MAAIFSSLQKNITSAVKTLFYDASAEGTTSVQYSNAKINTSLNSVILSSALSQGLPIGYTQLSYIQGNGTSAYIKTGFIPTNTSKIEITTKVDLNKGYVFGTKLNSNPIDKFSFNTSTNYAVEYGADSNTFSDITSSITDKFILTVDGINSTATIESSEVGTKTINLTSSTFASAFPIALFGLNAGTGNISEVEQFSDAKIYTIKLYENGTLKFNGIPCKSSDSKYGFYDIVNKLFYYHADLTGGIEGVIEPLIPTPDEPLDIVCNNGTIKWGVEGLPSEYIPVEYLEVADQVAYISTNVYQTVDGKSGSSVCSKAFVSATLAYTQDYSSGRRLMGGNGRQDNYFGLYNSTRQFCVYMVDNPTHENSVYIDQSIELNKKYRLTYEQTNTSTILEAFDENEFKLGTATSNWGENRLLTDCEYQIFRINMGYDSYYTRVYNYYIEIDGVAVANFVPCIQKSTNIAGMYDTIRKRFFTSANSYTFITGPEIPDVIYASGVTEKVTDNNGNTTEVQPLLVSGTISDTHDIIQGLVIHNVMGAFLDGTESWVEYDNGYYVNKSSLLYEAADNLSTTAIKCTHLYNCISTDTEKLMFAVKDKFPTLQEWKDFITSQVNLNKSILVTYSLKTPYEEYVKHQTLTVKQPNDTITISQGTMTELPIKVIYEARK